MIDKKSNPQFDKFHKTLFFFVLICLIISRIRPYDVLTWHLEVMPAIIGIFVLIVTYKKFKFTNFTYCIIVLEALVLIIGGHYTYAKEPVFNFIKDVFNLKRNYYDRFGHFMQGFVPAIIAREYFVRSRIVRGKNWLNFIIVSICLAVSAMYELIEFVAAHILGRSAEAFLGTQGDVWDTQWDMLFALIGSIVAILLFSKIQDRFIREMKDN